MMEINYLSSKILRMQQRASFEPLRLLIKEEQVLRKIFPVSALPVKHHVFVLKEEDKSSLL